MSNPPASDVSAFAYREISKASQLTKSTALKGRFLHVTDFHPDPHYKTGASFSSGCHSKPKKDKGKGKGNGPNLPSENEPFEVGPQKQKGKEKEVVAGRWGSAVS